MSHTPLATRQSVTDAVRRHDPNIRGFVSDNNAGVHPEILAAIDLANGGHEAGYGSDSYTQHLQDLFRHHFGPLAQAYPVFNGTGANVTALQALSDRWGAVICPGSAHINVDECGAPERMAGLKLLRVTTPDGKLTPALIDEQVGGFGSVHSAQPQVVSITQSTELGTCYSPDEIQAISDHAHKWGMALHMDGARISNAAASLGVSLAELTTDVGVDVLSFGGTKNGLLLGECVVVLNPDRVRGVDYLRKQSMQLASKMRFISVQFEALLGGDLWLRSARQSNAMARRLSEALKHIDGITIPHPVQANAVFAKLPPGALERVRNRQTFHAWDEPDGTVRWMCSFDTTEADVDAFAALVAEEIGAL
ncbi:threonine aldolase family protein [Paenarthrobacter nitroguajacolicus]